MASIRIQNLSKAFGPMQALCQIDLHIKPGELFFLLGPSGCGKTTLLRCLAGFYQPDAGAMFIGDEDITRQPPERRHTGMVFQSHALWPHKTVAGNVAFGLEEAGVGRAEIRSRVAAALGAVRMGAHADRRPAELSGGQQQRVALARALVVRPRCLLLDEPLSNLDTRSRSELSEEIQRVCREFRLTTIHVTHDQKEALSTADRLAVMGAGRILQVGTPRDLHRRPENRAVAEFIGDANFIPAKFVRLTEGRAVVETALGKFEGVLAGAAAPALGTPMTLAVHPGCWTLAPVTGASSNAARGRIVATRFTGDAAQHVLETAQGLRLRIAELNGFGERGLLQGEVEATVKPDDVTLLPD